MASFDSGVTYKGAVGLASIEENLPITTKSVLISPQFLNNLQRFYITLRTRGKIEFR